MLQVLAFTKKLASPLASYNIYRYTLPFPYILGRQDVETKFWKRFGLEKERAKRPGCVVSLISDTSSVHVRSISVTCGLLTGAYTGTKLAQNFREK